MPRRRDAERSARLRLTPTLVSWINGMGVGAWFSYDIMPAGLFAKLPDAIDIEGGGILATRQIGDTRYYAFSPLVGGRWRYAFTRDWDLFTSVRTGAALRTGGYGMAYGLIVTAGAEWKLTETARIRAELAYPGAVLAGLSLPLGAAAAEPSGSTRGGFDD